MRLLSPPLAIATLVFMLVTWGVGVAPFSFVWPFRLKFGKRTYAACIAIVFLQGTSAVCPRIRSVAGTCRSLFDVSRTPAVLAPDRA